ncbi:MAG: co-chaperone GroES [bacterium]|nr:co-chaperone GroES [bacterium]
MKKQSSNTKINIQPVGDRVLVRPEEVSKKTPSGIIIPVTAEKEKATRGTIIAVGPGKFGDEGDLIPMTVKVGQNVFFNPGWENEIEVDGEKLFIISESDVRAIIK